MQEFLGLASLGLTPYVAETSSLQCARLRCAFAQCMLQEVHARTDFRYQICFRKQHALSILLAAANMLNQAAQDSFWLRL